LTKLFNTQSSLHHRSKHYETTLVHLIESFLVIPRTTRWAPRIEIFQFDKQNKTNKQLSLVNK
jgi:hypothetical protein